MEPRFLLLGTAVAGWLFFLVCLLWSSELRALTSDCSGDCGGEGSVSVAELVTLMNVALRRAPLLACPEADRDGNERIEIGEVAGAVEAALSGCAPRAGVLSVFFGLDDALPAAAAVLCPGAPGMDGMPVVFAAEIDQTTLDPEDFLVTTEQGAAYVPLCVTRLPAGEENEDRTVLLIGDFGNAMADPPRLLEITGTLSTERGEDLRGQRFEVVTPLAAGPFLVLAEVVPENESELGRLGPGGGCPVEGTRQVVRVTWAGGVRAPSGDEVADAARQSYRVYVSTEEFVVPFALADLNDMDNNHDLCLDDPRRPLRVEMEAGRVIDPGGDPNPFTAVEVTACD